MMVNDGGKCAVCICLGYVMAIVPDFGSMVDSESDGANVPLWSEIVISNKFVLLLNWVKGLLTGRRGV